MSLGVPIGTVPISWTTELQVVQAPSTLGPVVKTVSCLVSDGTLIGPQSEPSKHDHVRIAQNPGGVQLEGVVHERSAEKVAPDEHALVPETGFGEEGVGRAEVPGRHLMGGDARSGARGQYRCRFRSGRTWPRLTC